MVRDKNQNISNKSQYILAISEPSSPTTERPVHTNRHKKQDSDLISYLMKIIETLKEDINNSLKEKPKNTGKLVENLKRKQKIPEKNTEKSQLNR